MGSETRRIAVLCALLATVAPLGSARAGERPRPSEDIRRAARELAREGVRRFDAGDWDGARELFTRAYRLVPAPTVAVREARALVKLGRLPEAADAYARAAGASLDASSPAPYRDAVAQAKLELEDLRPRIPRLLVTLIGVDKSTPHLEVELDGEPMPVALLGVERAVAPGLHAVVARVGSRSAVERVNVREREVSNVVLHLSVDPPDRGAQRGGADAPQSKSGPTRALGWTAVAIGGTGIAVGVTTGVLALRRESDLAAKCPNATCPPSAASDLETYEALKNASTVGYVAGGVTAAIGFALVLLSAASEPQKSDRRAWLKPTVHGVRGSF